MTPERFEPNRSLNLGIGVWREMASELWRSRELVGTLFVRNLTARYKQSLLGFAWALIIPFVAIGTFVALHRAGVVSLADSGAPYVVFALAGLTVFQLFSSGITAGCGALVEAGDMIAKVSFPRETLVLASLAGALFEFLVKVLLLSILCAWHGIFHPLQLVLYIFAAVPILVFTSGLALLLSLMNAVFRDTAQAAGMLAFFLMFLTPVLYPSGSGAWLLNGLNPLNALVQGPRDLLLRGSLTQPLEYCGAVLLSVLVFLLAWRLFHLAETRIPERI